LWKNDTFDVASHAGAWIEILVPRAKRRYRICESEEMEGKESMKVKYLGKSDSLMLLNGKIYEVIAVEQEPEIVEP